jgi:hypothetical protein
VQRHGHFAAAGARLRACVRVRASVRVCFQLQATLNPLFFFWLVVRFSFSFFFPSFVLAQVTGNVTKDSSAPLTIIVTPRLYTHPAVVATGDVVLDGVIVVAVPTRVANGTLIDLFDSLNGTVSGNFSVYLDTACSELTATVRNKKKTRGREVS